MTTLRAQAVSRVFETAGEPVHAVQDVTLEVAPGELLVVTGPSGAGKTTLLNLLGGLVYLVLGVFIVEKPGMAAEVVTLVLAVGLVLDGTFRIAAALALRFPSWGWVLLNGVATLVLGVLIWRRWPGDSVWILGLLLGIDLLFHGWTWLMLGLAVRAAVPPAPTQP